MKNKTDIFNEFDRHLLEDERPSLFFNELLRNTGIFASIFPFTVLGELVSVPQSEKYHPEGNVWNHTMMVVDNAAQRRNQSKNPRVFMWAALLHDIGKKPTTAVRRGRITSYNHDRVGERMTVDFLKEFTNDREFIYSVSKLVRWHMQILFVVEGLPFANIGRMAKETSIEEVALLGLCDRLGRGGMTGGKEREEYEAVARFLEKVKDFLHGNT